MSKKQWAAVNVQKWLNNIHIREKFHISNRVGTLDIARMHWNKKKGIYSPEITIWGEIMVPPQINSGSLLLTMS